MNNSIELTKQLEQRLPEYRETLLKNGWVCLKNVFSIDEVEEFRRLAYLSVGERYTNTDLLSNPHFRDVLLGERMLMAAKGLLNDKPVYFGESKVLVDGFNGRHNGSIHKDNPDRHDGNGPDWDGEYKIIRFAIFCQDHAKHSEGITMRNGSHKTPNWYKGKLEHVPSEPGDIVAFYFTTTHSGYAKRVKFFPKIKFTYDYVNKRKLSKLLTYIPSRMLVGRDKIRIVLFSTFAAKSPHLDRYLEYCKYRSFSINTWKGLRYTDEVLDYIKKRKDLVEVLDMSDIPNQVDIKKVGGHVQLPY